MSIEAFHSEDQGNACRSRHRKEADTARLGYLYHDRKNILPDIHSDLVPLDVVLEDTGFVTVGGRRVPRASDGEEEAAHHLHSSEDDTGLALPPAIVDILFHVPLVNQHTMWIASVVVAGFDLSIWLLQQRPLQRRTDLLVTLVLFDHPHPQMAQEVL